MNRLTLILLVIALAGVRVAFALDPERPISELAHRSWGIKDGAPPDAFVIAQTTDGYLWIGGYAGLYRFDGARFEAFEAFSKPALRSREISSLFASPDGKLWIGYRNGGISVLDAGKLTHYDSTHGLPEGRVWGFAQDRDGRIWVATARGVASFEGGRWRGASFPDSGASAVLVDHRGALWFAGEHRAAVLDPASSKFELTDEPYNGGVYHLAESPDGTVWMAEVSRAVRPLNRPGQGTPFPGMSRLECQTRFPDTWQTERRCRRPEDLEVRVGSMAMLFDRNGSFWITTAGDGLRRAPYPSRLKKEPIGEFSHALEQFTGKDGLSGDFVTTILEDREGNIWTTTPDTVDQFRDSDLAAVDLGSNAGDLFVVPDNDGYVFALDNSGRLYRFRDARERVAVPVSGSGEFALFLYRDPLGSIWALGTDGACRLVGRHCIDRFERPGKKRGALGRSGFVRWRFAIDGARLWAYVEDEGLFVREDGNWKAVTGVPGSATGFVPDTQFTDASGQIWFGFTNGQLLSVKDGLTRTYSSQDGLTVGPIKAIDSLGAHVWVGGERGVALLSGSRFTSVVPYDLPAFDTVSGVLEGGDGSLWLNEHRGVVHIPPAEVEGILQNRVHRAQYEVLDSHDGLPGVSAGITRFPTAVRGTDGRLWFVVNHGVAWADPRRLYRNKLPPPVAIQSIVADGNAFAPSGQLELPGTTGNLQIAYTGLSLSVPERVQFRYRLQGLDREWQDAGTRRTAIYSRLPPGSYTFQVIASNDAGVWNNVGAALRIVITPAWYQTWWFYALCVLLLAAVLAALYRARVAQVRSETRRSLEVRLLERERIARELHDTLLQGMHGLILRLQAATNRIIPADQPARELMEQSLDRADELLEESRSRLQDLRLVANAVDDLADALAVEGQRLAQGHTARFRVTVRGPRRDLHAIVRDEVFLIGREALGNSFRHSGANEVEAEVTFGDAALRVIVRDDGRGIGPSVLEAGGSPGHFGLVGMRERATKLGGQLEIRSTLGSGTEIDLQVPAGVAYTPQNAAAPRARSWLAVFRSST